MPLETLQALSGVLHLLTGVQKWRKARFLTALATIKSWIAKQNPESRDQHCHAKYFCEFLLTKFYEIFRISVHYREGF